MNLLPAQTLSGYDRIHVCKAERLLTALPSNSIDLILTSPPYDNLRKYKGFSWNFEYIAQQSYRVLKQGGVLAWVVADATIDGSETFTSFRQALYFRDVAGFKAWDTMIWNKNAMPGDFGKRYRPVFEFMFVFAKGEPSTWRPTVRRNATAGQWKKKGHSGKDGWKTSEAKQTPEESVLENVWYIPVGGGVATDKVKHPAMFPEELARRHIVTWTNEGDTVLDFFMGSGTTAKMATLNNRRFIDCDISAEYVEIARQRVAKAREQVTQLPMFAADAA